MKESELSSIFIDRLITRYEHWMLDHEKSSEEIKQFIQWCKKEEQEYLNAKRSPDNKSYLERESKM